MIITPVPQTHQTHVHDGNNECSTHFNLKAAPGAHNDVTAEEKGRSFQRPRKRLKFENVLTVVPLLFLACMRTCTNTCMETSQRTRKSTRTPFVVKQRKETVADLEKYCTTT